MSEENDSGGEEKKKERQLKEKANAEYSANAEMHAVPDRDPRKSDKKSTDSSEDD